MKRRFRGGRPAPAARPSVLHPGDEDRRGPQKRASRGDDRRERPAQAHRAGGRSQSRPFLRTSFSSSPSITAPDRLRERVHRRRPRTRPASPRRSDPRPARREPPAARRCDRARRLRRAEHVGLALDPDDTARGRRASPAGPAIRGNADEKEDVGAEERRGAQRAQRSEGKARHDERTGRLPGPHPASGRDEVVRLAAAVVVGPGGRADSTEIEPEGGEREPVRQQLRRPVDDLRVHGPAVAGMRVRDDRGAGGRGRRPQEALEAPAGPGIDTVTSVASRASVTAGDLSTPDSSSCLRIRATPSYKLSVPGPSRQEPS